MDWISAVETVIETANQRNPQYVDVIDDIVAGRLHAGAIEAKYGSKDLVVSALSHVTRAVHGIGSGAVRPLADGGWYERDGDRYEVAPGLRDAWWAARNRVSA
ncbi:hypothetical protein CCR97_12640 [Rhodoplanes elegans]|uniref:Uncharacterized protein n=1 Tax=Rhodoplanes elegans TaxID=29408 RepID=A0A327K5I6_9BRAD|nr:hypothetical protein [Rhodoplanes elegans]MBK5959050.1 hypothetical protein [Rhodoplanes elegans]RAI33939.1 hypothetical protein CH338_21760 [Rhodoplanes elegans]